MWRHNGKARLRTRWTGIVPITASAWWRRSGNGSGLQKFAPVPAPGGDGRPGSIAAGGTCRPAAFPRRRRQPYLPTCPTLLVSVARHRRCGPRSIVIPAAWYCFKDNEIHCLIPSAASA